jgi:asparagine synthase (glutamine-hydrolysing)
MQRHLGIIWNPGIEEQARPAALLVNSLSRRSRWSTIHSQPGALVAQSGARNGITSVVRLQRGHGVIIGTLFRRGDYGRVREVSDNETDKIVSSQAGELIQNYWGSYVAFIFDGSICNVVREPTRSLPCYHMREAGIHIFFSHAEDLASLVRVKFAINRKYLTRWLTFSRLLGDESALDGVEELLGGERVTISAEGTKRTLLWDPLRLANTAKRDPPSNLAIQLRTTVQETIDAWASCYDSVGHQLSGGLDSSIVAGCLARAPTRPAVTYVNFSIDSRFDERLHLDGVDKATAAKLRAIAGQGDERYFARLIASRWNVPMVERERSNSMDLARLWQAPLTINPTEYFTSIESDEAQIALAASSGIQCFFSGLGGDSVLLATMQPYPGMDYVALNGIGPSVLSHLAASCILSKESIWTVLKHVLKHSVFKRPYDSPIELHKQPSLLADSAADCLRAEDFENPWSLAATRLPPGKRAHLRGLCDSTHFDSIFISGDHVDHVEPLNSQPVWELMLQIPTYTILSGGVSRGLARMAFADLLPAEVRRRQSKGSGTTFYQHVVRSNRSYLRDMLVGGLLVQDRYLDQQKVEAYLCADEPFGTVPASQVLSYLCGEIWYRQWLATQARRASAESSARRIAGPAS